MDEQLAWELVARVLPPDDETYEVGLRVVIDFN